MFDQQVLDALARPIDPTRVKSRSGGRGTSLSYIEAHDAIRTANTIFGLGNWGYRVQSLEFLGEEPLEKDGRQGFRVAYGAVVEVTIKERNVVGPEGGIFIIPTTTFSDTGYGDAVEYTGSKLTGHELARKEAVSDGIKRALKNFGEQFGLSLYDEAGRADVARRAKLLSSETALKNEVFRIAKERLGREKPAAALVASVWGLEPGALADRMQLVAILEREGVL